MCCNWSLILQFEYSEITDALAREFYLIVIQTIFLFTVTLSFLANRIYPQVKYLKHTLVVLFFFYKSFFGSPELY